MAKAKVVVTATDDLAKGLNNSKKQLSDFEKFLNNIGKQINKAFSFAAISAAAVTAFKAMSAAAKQCIEEYSEAEKISKRMEAVWTNVGAATGKSSKQIDDYAESIEKVTYFSAESVKESALLLAATESLTEDGFQRALDVSVDLAAALGEDVSSAASTLAKALVAPDEAFRSLKTVGVAFTDAEKDQIKALIDAGQEYEAQALILDKIEQKYKGVAQAINNTPAGKLDNIKDTLSDIRKSLGGALLDAISPALESLYNWLTKISGEVANLSTSTSVISRLQSGSSDLTGFGVAQLELALKSVQEALKSNIPEFKAHRQSYLKYEAILQDELAYRATLGTVASAGSGGSDGGLANEIGDAVNSALSDYLKSYGKNSSQYQKDALIAAIDEALAYRSEFRTTDFLGNKVWSQAAMEKYGLDLSGIKAADQYLGQIIIALEKQLNPSEVQRVIKKSGLTGKDSIYVEPTEAELQREAFNEALPGTLTSNLGEFGSVVAEATSNISQMGAGLGTLMTVIKPIIQGINQVVGPMLDAITTTVLEPLLEVGKAVGSLLLPVLTLLAPVLEVLGEGIIVVASVFQWVGQLLSHWAAAFVNSFSWITGFSMRDPGNPGNILDYIQGNLETYRSDVSGATYGSGSVGTDTAISSASYRGATSVTINIYAEGPIVGDGGMREFARMIRDEFDALDYYGVTA